MIFFGTTSLIYWAERGLMSKLRNLPQNDIRSSGGMTKQCGMLGQWLLKKTECSPAQ